MRIAQIAPLAERVPPKKYGGTERIVHTLTEELVARGHDVTLFASGDSVTNAKLESLYPVSLREAHAKDPYGSSLYLLSQIGRAYTMQNEFDIIHDHTAPLSLPTANIATTPVVMTLHGAFNAENRVIFRELQRPAFVGISQAQIRALPSVRYAGVIYNGLNMESFPFSETHDGYLLFVGRISLQKGTHHAIEVAQYLHMPLIIAAKLDLGDLSYFNTFVEPKLGGIIRWIGEVSEEERNNLMAHAAALLHPVTWREPFGLVLIESMACGTPVIAFNKGSIPELIVHGKTGFVVNDTEEMIEAVVRIGDIDRKTCRNHALVQFNEKKMTDEYEMLYEKLLLGR